MLIKELMEKLSKLNPEQEMIVEGLEDEVETSEEETVETPEEEVSVWDRETEYNDPQSQGIHQIIKNAHDFKVGHTGKMKAPGADKDSPDEGVYYDENNNTLSDKKKLKLISKWKAIEAIQDGSWTHGGFGGHLDDEIELPKYPEYKQKYDDWCASSKYDPSIDIGLDMQLEKQFGSDEEDLDECGSACAAPIKEEAEEPLDECGSACAAPIKEEAEEPLEEAEKPTEPIQRIKVSEDWEVIAPKTFSQLQRYCHDKNGFSPCEKKYFDLYMEKGPLYIITNVKTGEKFLSSPAANVVADVNDNLVNAMDLIEREPALAQYLPSSEKIVESIEARLNEQMKTDYQKDLESISDFLF